MDAWRDRYDSWKLAPGNTVHADVEAAYTAYIEEDADGLSFEDWLAERDSQAEDAAIERAERAREDMMFDREDRDF